jgi:BRCA1-associated protein
LNPSTARGDGAESNLDPAIVDKLSIIHIEFEALLEAQLAEQQLYFEKQYVQETWDAIETSHSSDIRSSKVSIPFATEGQLDVLEAMKIEISAIEADHQDVLNAMKDVQQEIRLLKKSNDAFIREQKAMKEHIKQLSIREEDVTRERNERVADLRQQIIDLTVYMDTQGKIQSSPMRDEIIGGTIQTVLPPPPSTDRHHDKHDRKKKK